ncbi:hypothetical protein Ais01nite_65660 [Asanoa ishikariensis]|uniref:Uncharacterized protein n=1 Tax=Asanoa ishikariensis TaxID=137265 RepID=A0A1H3NMY6_9ACTN|nr:hypothetical protein [Asanoa ishikariensis]GIF68531.1 hypothetical protein Ais01nite_65660 [Asanoa ishikariensis]SDY89785.1 hypothetical protein SAMN05421684_2159 [Asanoa ishikariensis]
MSDEKPVTFAMRCMLVILMAEARELPNARIADRGLDLKKEYRDRLVSRGWITVRKVGRGYSLELTEAGWAEAIGQLSADPPAGAGAGGAALYTVLNRLRGFLDRSDLAASELFAPAESDIDVRIRKAYAEIAVSAGELVSLAALRPRVTGAERAGVDAALVALSTAPDVRIVPESNQKTLSAEQRDAAVRIGNQDRHLIAIGV